MQKDETYNDTQVGTLPYVCPTCGNSHIARVRIGDVRRGFILEVCPERGGGFNKIDLPEGETRPDSATPSTRARANSLNSNYPDNWSGF